MVLAVCLIATRVPSKASKFALGSESFLLPSSPATVSKG